MKPTPVSSSPLTNTLPENPFFSESSSSFGHQVFAVSSNGNELNTGSPQAPMTPSATENVLGVIRSVRGSLASEESAGSHTSHSLLVRERILAKSRVLGHFNPTVAADIAYGSTAGFGVQAGSVEPTGSASLLNARSVASTCAPCPSFPPIYPGIPLTVPSSTTNAPTTTLASTSSSASTNLSTSSYVPTSTRGPNVTSGNETTASNEIPESQRNDQSNLSVSVWARSGFHYEGEYRGDPNSHFWIPAVQQVAYRTETGMMLENVASGSLSASTGIQRDSRNGQIEYSVFTQSAVVGNIGQLWGSDSSAPAEGIWIENGIRTAMDRITGGAGVGFIAQERMQQHWIFGNTSRSWARTGIIGATLVLAHAAGSAAGAWIGANLGFMAHGLAIGGSAAVSAVSAAFNAFSATRADHTVVVTDASLAIPMRLRFNQEEIGSYIDMSITPQLRFSSEILAAEPPEPLESAVIPVLIEMQEMDTRPALVFGNSPESRSRSNDKEASENNDSRV